MFKVEYNTLLGEVMDLPGIRPFADCFLQGKNEVSQNIHKKTVADFGRAKESIKNALQRLIELNENSENYFRLYPDKDCEDDERKKYVNVLRFPALNKEDGKKNPYVVVCPGGGYVNVWSITEGYTIANWFSKRGFTAFVLTYRVIGPDLMPKPLDDVSEAIKFIDSHADYLEVPKGNYILGGFSAGGNLAALWGCDSTGYMHYGLPKPKMLFPIYAPIQTAKRSIPIPTTNYPPSYIAACKDDPLVNYTQSFILKEYLDNVGVRNIVDIGEKGGHGFGDGEGSDCAGWIDRAIAFLEDLKK